MLNRRLVIVIAAVLFLASSGRTELPDTTWLRDYGVTSKGHYFDDMQRFASLYADQLDADLIAKLRVLLSKVATGGSELTTDDFSAARAALRLLAAAKTPGLVEIAAPLMHVSQNSVDRIAAEVMAATGSEATVEHIEAAFQNDIKKWLSGDPLAVLGIWDSLRCFAINGTPKARAAYDRGRSQIAEAVKTRNEEDRKWEREIIANVWKEVEKEKAGKGLPDPSEARHVWPASHLNIPTQDALGSETFQPNAAAPVPAVGKAGESLSVPGGWALWGGIAAVLAAVAGWLFMAKHGSRNRGLII